MKNLVLIATCALFLFSCQNQAQSKKSKTKMNTTEAVAKENIYQFKVKDLSGDTFDFASLKGKKIMIVNTASKCGLTPQYKDLEATYKAYKDKGFVIVGFPANNFASQEPGTNDEIAAFCQQNYGVSFPMMDKNSYLLEKFNHGFAYWIYGFMGLLAAFFVWKFIPETKAKTLEEMNNLWNDKAE